MTLSKKIALGVLLFAVAGGCARWWLTAHTPQRESATISTMHSAAPANAMASAVPAKKVDSVEVMIEGLRARLEKEPNDINGWVLLGRSYHFLERWDDAKVAFAKARALGYQGDGETAADTATSASAPMHADADAVFNDIGHIGSTQTTAIHTGAKP